jgi:hypothetical protein
MIGALESRAASRAATTVEEEVTFCKSVESVPGEPRVESRRTYNGGNGEVFLLSVLEKVQHIIADDNALLARQDILDTHVDSWESGAVGLEVRGGRK